MTVKKDTTKAWNKVKIKDFGTVSTGTTPSTKKEEYYGGAYKLISPSDLTDSKYITTAHKFISDEGLKVSRTLPKNSVLVGCIGNVGKIGITTDEISTFNQQINAVVCNDNFDADFVYYLLRYNRPLLESKAAKVTLPILNKNNFENIEFDVPELSEQKLIAKTLSSVQDAIMGQEELIAKLKDLKQCMMQQLFTHGTKGEKTKITEIGEIPESWKLVELKEIISSLAAGVSVNSYDRAIKDGEYGILKTSCVTLGIFDSRQNKAVIEKEVARLATPLKSDTIVISRMNTPELVGANAYVKNGNPLLFLPDRLWQIELKDYNKHSMRWIAYYLQLMWQKGIFADISSGTSASMKNITKARLLGLTVGVASFDEQSSIALRLEAIDVRLEVVQEKLSNYQNLFKTLLHELLSRKRKIAK